MGKVTDLGSVPPDDPMFLGGPQVFSNQQFKRFATTSASDTAGATPARPSTSVLPPPPKREAFKSQEEFEEARGYWQSHVGRIKAMADRARRSPDSPPASSSTDEK